MWARRRCMTVTLALLGREFGLCRPVMLAQRRDGGRGLWEEKSGMRTGEGTKVENLNHPEPKVVETNWAVRMCAHSIRMAPLVTERSGDPRAPSC
ncbi:hypothetical protein L209DRAFT_44076 [Thermothelomyces heterothallicus CBS 203.75]